MPTPRDKEKKIYNLIQSYVKRKFFISTAYRQSSACVHDPPWYYETLGWKWNEKTGERGEMIDTCSEETPYKEKAAYEWHMEVCRRLLNADAEEEAEDCA